MYTERAMHVSLCACVRIYIYMYRSTCISSCLYSLLSIHLYTCIYISLYMYTYAAGFPVKNTIKRFFEENNQGDWPLSCAAQSPQSYAHCHTPYMCTDIYTSAYLHLDRADQQKYETNDDACFFNEACVIIFLTLLLACSSLSEACVIVCLILLLSRLLKK